MRSCAITKPTARYPSNTVEAVMCGIPVVASQDTGCGELLDRFGAGFLVPYGDAGKMAATIDSILADPVQAREKTLKARESVKEQLAWTAIASRYEEAYQAAAGPWPSTP